ncbi:MAG: FAD-dependent oxidoreductase, partial [Pseudomonadota bacterium]
GKAPTEADVDSYEHFHLHTDLVVVGGGMAGIAAAKAAASSGAEVLLLEQTAQWGGRALVDGVEIDGLSGPDWVAREIAALEAMPNVHLRRRTMGAGVYDHGYMLAYERVGDHAPGTEAPRHRLWRIRAKKILIASGAIERPLTFAMNDVPGVMLASAVRDYVTLYGVAPGKRTVIAANNDDAYRTALALHGAGVKVSAVVDIRTELTGPLPGEVKAIGIPVYTGHGIAKVKGTRAVEGVEIGRITRSGRMTGTPTKVMCDCVAMSGGWSPVVHLWSHCGGKLTWDAQAAMFRPDPARPATGADGQAMTHIAGAANGALGAEACLADALAVGAEAVRAMGFEPQEISAVATAPEEAPLHPHWFTPALGKYFHGTKHFVDFQNDVTAADVRLAAQEGYESVEHTKRYTTLGMATDQGKTSNINGLALLAEELGKTIPEVGTTTFRPPYTPISMGAIAGRNAGELFKPVRQTRMHGWHGAHGADFEPVADWYRPFCFRRPGETRKDAVTREILNTRQHVGLLDASTLGKIAVKGPDAGKFLDLIYTNMMSSLKPGRCRYGLMCTENGFLFDDGVVVRVA